MFDEDCRYLEPERFEPATLVTVALRGTDRALLRALMLRTGLSEAEVLRVALLGLASPRDAARGSL